VTGNFDILEWSSGVPLEIIMDLLTPKIASITAEGLSLSGDLTGEELRLTDADISVRGTVAVGLELRAVERTICVTGVVEGTAVRQCVRCLKEFDDPVAFSVRAVYERETKAATSTLKRDDPRKRKAALEVEIEPDDQNDDVYYYVGDHLELAPMLREQWILASPMHPLCADECLGLCARCGTDLNAGPCRCAAEPTGGPFQMLRDSKSRTREPADR
jgi:uncharacterized protein